MIYCGGGLKPIWSAAISVGGGYSTGPRAIPRERLA